MTLRARASKPLSWMTIILACIGATACVHPAGQQATQSLPWSNAGQMLLVTTAEWDADTGTLRRYTRTPEGWRQDGNDIEVSVGRSGAAWGIGLHPTQDDGGPIKQEGDGRAPAGVFAIGDAFGYAGTADTALPYTQMQASSYCMDVADSPLYNRIVDAKVVGEAAVQGSTEPMRLDLHNMGDQRYSRGFVIRHNPQAVPGAGSCIFAHVWKAAGAPTAGCTAMDAPMMQSLYGWLQPTMHPVFVLLPDAEYERLRAAWQLPG